jgi:hypothetical protein
MNLLTMLAYVYCACTTVVQAFAAEKHAKNGEVVIAQTAHRLISSHFKAEERYPDELCTHGQRRKVLLITLLITCC